MKKLMKSFVILAVVAIALGSVGAVFAQGASPENAAGFGGIGNQGKRGGRGSGVDQNSEGTGDGLLHDLMIAAFAEELNLTVLEIEESLAAGQTMLEISGLEIDEFRTLMQDVHTEVRKQAVAEGLLPEFQADGMNARRGGIGKFGRGMQGQGQGLYGTGDCLND